MRKILLAICLILCAPKVFSQQFSHYNTGTVYESFENPSVQTFTPDSSRQYAFNLFIPNISGNLYITGNSQSSLKSRFFNGSYDNTQLKIDKGAFNQINANVNVYLIMFKAFTNLSSNGEIGFSVQTRGESRGVYTDESVAIFNGPGAFAKDHYDNIFNNALSYQTYNQVSFSYSEKINKKFALGIKLSALMGIQYQKLTINQSSIDFDRINDNALLGLSGKYYLNYTPGPFGGSDLLPTFRNPGASISIGTTLRTADNFILQGNLKDLGFIKWASRSGTYTFNTQDTLQGLSSFNRENNIYLTTRKMIRTGAKFGSFVTPTNGKIELSANKKYWLDYDKKFRYSPTIIASKELFYNGFTIAMVNPVSYKNITVSATSSYDQYKIFNMGGQFMVKSSNAEFFIGSERLLQTGNFIRAGMGNNAQINKNGAYSGADIFLGFSLKFGSVIEHPMNASHIPMADGKGFFSTLWGRIFKHGE
ncbi:MAG: hypothetical protein JWR05_1543 [Mucilaginibacter sp.]|nr:hypothetical protein [Mucilaginibacter sp.]